MGSAGARECVRNLTAYLCLLMAIATMGPLLYGFHLAELNAPQDVITCKKEAVTVDKTTSHLSIAAFLPSCIPMEEAQFAVVSSIFTLGGLLGALSAGPISTAYGRLLAMRLASVFYIFSGTVEALAPSIIILSAGRFLSGVGAGCSLVVVPLYIAEIAPVNERGVFGVMTQITINTGILITQTLGYFLSRGSLWRIILAAGSGLGLLQLIGLFFIPESPAWTAANKDPQVAMKVLQRIRGRDADIAEEVQAWKVSQGESFTEAQGLLNESERSVRPESAPSKRGVGLFEVISNPFYRPAIIAVVGVMCAQQLTGINSVMMYSVSLLSDLFPGSSALLTIAISVMNFVATVLFAPLSDRLGRKTCLLISISGMACASFALAFSIYFAIKILSAVSVLLFVAVFAIGLGPIPFILASELVGQEAKGATQSVALIANWITTFIIAQFFPIVNTALGGRGLIYFFFGGMAVLAVLFVALMVPESKGKKDADDVWGRHRRVD